MCKNDELERYNFHKEENLKYCKKMFEENILKKEKYTMLLDY